MCRDIFYEFSCWPLNVLFLWASTYYGYNSYSGFGVFNNIIDIVRYVKKGYTMTTERPLFDKSRVKLYNFKLDDGKSYPAMEYTLNDMVLFPRQHPQVSTNGWAEKGDGSYSSKGKWFPHEVRTISEAYDIHANKFKFPIELKHQAEINAKKLYDAIVELGAPKILRNQVTGRFDPRKAGKLWVEAHRGGDIEAVRPFTKRLKTNPKRPHVAVLACGGWRELHGSGENYIPDLSVALMSIVWACQAIDCNVTSALCRNVMSRPTGGYSMGTITVSSPETTPSLGSFSGLLHTNMYRFGNTAMYMSHPDAHALTHHKSDCNETADSNCPAVQWAKNQLGATFVICVGREFSDIKKADMVIGYNEVGNIDKLIDKIAAELYKQRMDKGFISNGGVAA